MVDNKRVALKYLDSANVIAENAVTYMFIGAAKITMYGNADNYIYPFTKAIELDSSNWIAYSYRGDGYHSKKDVQSAFDDYSKVIEIRPKAKEGYKNRGIILLQHGYYQQAYKDFSKALAIDMTDYDLFFNRAVAAMNLNAISNAISDLTHILESKDGDGEAHYLMHSCYLLEGDSSNALVQLDSASKFSKYKRDYHLELIELATIQSRPDICLEAHNRLVKYSYFDYKYRLQRAKFLYETGNYEQAIDDLKKYLSRSKDCSEGNYYLACAFEKSGDLKSSSKYFKKAERLGYKKVPIK